MLEKVRRREATVCVVGLGYVGLPTAVAFATAGFPVIGADIDDAKVKHIAAGDSPLPDVPLAEPLKAAVKAGKLRATTDVTAAAAGADAILLTVPTPVTRDKRPDLSHVIAAGEAVAKSLRRGQLVVLESTTYPGTTEEVLQPILEKNGFRAGTDFGLGYCPERYNPGDPDHAMEKIVRIAAGITPEWAVVLHALYRHVAKDVVLVSTIRTAEAAKVIENIQRDLNVALINELSLIFQTMGLDTYEVIEAASTKWNFLKMMPGPGVGGHCLPVDPYYLTHKAEQLGYKPRLILAGRAVNNEMPHHVVRMAADGLRAAGKSVRGARVALLGLAYKAGTADLRESPAVEIGRELTSEGASVRAHDPFASKEAAATAGLTNHSLEEALKDADCVVVATDHPSIRKLKVSQLMAGMRSPAVLVDTRNLVRPSDVPPGVIYRSVGRPWH